MCLFVCVRACACVRVRVREPACVRVRACVFVCLCVASAWCCMLLGDTKVPSIASFPGPPERCLLNKYSLQPKFSSQSSIALRSDEALRSLAYSSPLPPHPRLRALGCKHCPPASAACLHFCVSIFLSNTASVRPCECACSSVYPSVRRLCVRNP